MPAIHRYDQVCLSTISYGSIWPVMTECDRIWHDMAKYEPVSSSMVVYERLRPGMDGYDPVWLMMAWYGQLVPSIHSSIAR